MRGKLGGGALTSQEDRCNRRRRLAALRDGVEAAPVQILKGGHRFPSDRSGTLRYALGSLPPDEDAALSTLNLARQASGHNTLKRDDIYIHYLEAANSNFIGDRWMFLDVSTLKNIATGGAHGFAFMNSHRTGGLSAPTELPFGRTFAGRYEEHEDEGRALRRSLVGVYMLKGTYPNGASGPSTDDMHASIEGGTLADVSMGLSGGHAVCDLCAVDLEEVDEDGDYVCPHVPGTHTKLSDEDREAQEARGVEGGMASYTLVNAAPQEVSAVYKGAVPGAGFRKAVEMASRRGLGRATGREIVLAYGAMLTRGERTRLGGKPMARKSFSLGDLFRRAEEAPEDLDGIELAVIERPQEGPQGPQGPKAGHLPTTMPETPPEAAQALVGLSPKDRALAIREARLDARDYLAAIKGKFSPHELEGVTTAYILAHVDDIERPAVDPLTDRPVKRVDLLKRANEHRAGFALAALATGREEIGDADVLKKGERALPPAGASEDDLARGMDETFALAATTEPGRVGLRDHPEGLAWLKRNGLA